MLYGAPNYYESNSIFPTDAEIEQAINIVKESNHGAIFKWRNEYVDETTFIISRTTVNEMKLWCKFCLECKGYRYNSDRNRIELIEKGHLD